MFYPALLAIHCTGAKPVTTAYTSCLITAIFNQATIKTGWAVDGKIKGMEKKSLTVPPRIR
jgi:hypothetical protein